MCLEFDKVSVPMEVWMIFHFLDQVNMGNTPLVSVIAWKGQKEA